MIVKFLGPLLQVGAPVCLESEGITELAVARRANRTGAAGDASFTFIFYFF